MDVSNLDIQHIDEDEASEDLSVVERELNDDYQPKSIFMNTLRSVRALQTTTAAADRSQRVNPQQFKDYASTGTGIQLWW